MVRLSRAPLQLHRELRELSPGAGGGHQLDGRFTGGGLQPGGLGSLQPIGKSCGHKRENRWKIVSFYGKSMETCFNL